MNVQEKYAEYCMYVRAFCTKGKKGKLKIYCNWQFNQTCGNKCRLMGVLGTFKCLYMVTCVDKAT